MNQARSEEEEKERKRDGKDRGQVMEREDEKKVSGELKQGLPRHSSG